MPSTRFSDRNTYRLRRLDYDKREANRKFTYLKRVHVHKSGTRVDAKRTIAAQYHTRTSEPCLATSCSSGVPKALILA